MDWIETIEIEEKKNETMIWEYVRIPFPKK